MTTYSVAEAKNGLPRLIDLALEGEEVIISRHGKIVVELRPVVSVERRASPASHAWLKARRLARAGVGMTSVQLLDAVYDETEG